MQRFTKTSDGDYLVHTNPINWCTGKSLRASSKQVDPLIYNEVAFELKNHPMSRGRNNLCYCGSGKKQKNCIHKTVFPLSASDSFQDFAK